MYPIQPISIISISYMHNPYLTISWHTQLFDYLSKPNRRISLSHPIRWIVFIDFVCLRIHKLAQFRKIFSDESFSPSLEGSMVWRFKTTVSFHGNFTLQRWVLETSKIPSFIFYELTSILSNWDTRFFRKWVRQNVSF